MDWVLSTVSTGSESFKLIHFDSVDYPIIPNSVVHNDSSLEEAETELGSVLWMDAIELFLPYLYIELANTENKSVLCLGEGTGACGCGLTSYFEKVFITDLPKLFPLLHANAKLNDPKIIPAILDWTDPSLTVSPSVIIGCEVLYGNRFVWPHLMTTLVKYAGKDSVVYLCVTLRNARRDIDDFRNEYLRHHYPNISEIALSTNVSVLKCSM